MKQLQTLIVIMFAAHGFAAAQVRVWQGTLTLPTYEEGAPDPNPPFDQYANNRFNYPYTMRHNLTDRRVDHAWRAVYIENEYLKCSVLPDIGGHLYTCTDKISGKPMFYENPSIKKADVAYRGAWAAFGIEFNFPVSHNWVTASPVDFSYAKNQDGSASVQVGNIDRVYGMQWTVELILRARSTVLEERVTLNNRSDVRHRFYWWNNAGVQVWDDSRIEYPMRFAASHGFREVQRWPLEADGNDLSIVKNHTKGPVSLFVHGSREPFMGVWHPHTNTGIVHFADYAQLPAKKIWSWGSDADGLDWRKALSDNNSAYVEVQAGLFRNQETYAFLEPRQTISFSEFWMPVREIGGITRANLAGVVNLVRANDALQVTLNVNQPLADATVQILNGKQTVFEARTSLVPERLWSHPAIVAAGRLADAKNYPLLLDAFAEVRRTVPARLFILGEGELEGALRQQVRAIGLDDAVVFCGFQRNPWKYIARADVFALSSRYEGFGNVLVEAMACGVPVVATASPGTREIVSVGTDGLLVDRHEPHALAAAIARILSDSVLRQRLSEGARSSAQRFALPTIAAAYDRVLGAMVK